MEDDPNKKESKGKRILKKAIRRNSKSNNSQSSVQNNSGVSRSKSFENQRLSVEINDSTPLPKPDGTKENLEGSVSTQKNKTDTKVEAQEYKRSSLQDRLLKDMKAKKIVAIQESQNEVFEDNAHDIETPRKDEDFKSPDDKKEPDATAGFSKKNLKRKLEEESGAGTSGASTGASDTDADDKDPSKDKKKKNRCAVCRKKVGLTGFECRCGGLFCAVHRYSDKHECSFDYRELGAQEIRRNNPVVVSQKIHKI
ncbi:uncharacterized protein drn isoform X1 [Epargyreus clarus]|uniref:uncharacterized protein drn isoform X1 n=1 Tax=Epargyreus clarus TaxID=520877 RepID=UPI003C2C0E3C